MVRRKQSWFLMVSMKVFCLNIMKKKTMYDLCPVCHGAKKIKQIMKTFAGNKEIETNCWACRGSGYVDYQEPEEITQTRIEEMFDSLGV